jgi:excisionase family DNA binding protein
MTPTEAVPQLVSIPELAQTLGTTVRHIRRLVAERRVPFIKVGGLVRFDPAEVARWLDCNRFGPNQPA